MKYKSLLFFLFLIEVFSSCTNKQILPIIKSNVKQVNYSVGGGDLRKWNLAPELKPDRLQAEVGNKLTPIKFITDIDSITFSVKEKDTVQFYIVKEKDSALTEIIGVPKNINFSDDFVKKYRGKFVVDVPEVSELANIMAVLSKSGQVDSTMSDFGSSYHKKVLKHFLPLQDHPAMDVINKNIPKPKDYNNGWWYFYALKMNSCGYIFDDKDNIVDDGIIHKMGFSNREDPFLKHEKLFSDFAKESGFRKFYQDNKPYYEKLIREYKILNPIDKMQNWLERKFPLKYGTYFVYFSPLNHGSHGTQRFNDNGLGLSAMWIQKPSIKGNSPTELDEVRNSRMVFTEIDHNYVNPISDKFLDKINTAFKDREKWSDDTVIGASIYNSPYMVFNEYMTWAVYSLYVHDYFYEELFNKYLSKYLEPRMVKLRGFSKFKEFNRKLVELYKQDSDRDINKLYTLILDWCISQ